MSGIYIHVPYCKQACHYCDFHFSVKKETKAAFVDALVKEIELQKNYLNGEKIETLYFGGGTPSLLSSDELNRIFEKLQTHFSFTDQAEITLEANPDDLNSEKISELKLFPINRLSLGIQSFFDKDLRWMNRAHDAAQSESSVKRAQDAGFENITIDLIYGLPEVANEVWEENLDRAFTLHIQHLSCYSLTVEPRTALAHFISAGKSKPINEEQAAQQYEILIGKMQEQNWLHYEISNFASNENFISKHNSAYWFGNKYLGLGPSAHSFDGNTRQWNARNNHRYINSLAGDVIPFEKEDLSQTQRINEAIMTRLRTIWGLPFSIFQNDPGPDFLKQIKQKSIPFMEESFVEMNEDSLILTEKGKMIADKIILELMIDD
ncbi:MAG: radical SAM family heme chaperone HemW [Chitinophagales bacterium]